MKNIVLTLVCMVFLVASVSALSWDNKLTEKDITFDGKSIQNNKLLEQYKPIEIKNYFGAGKTLFEGYLSQHTYSCGNECSSTIEINLLEDGVLIDDIRFKTLQKNGEWIEQPIRSYQFYVDGKLYLIGEEVKAGIYEVKLVGIKSASRTVDWQIKSQGRWIEEWATWGSGQEVIIDNSTQYSEPGEAYVLKATYTFGPDVILTNFSSEIYAPSGKSIIRKVILNYGNGSAYENIISLNTGGVAIPTAFDNPNPNETITNVQLYIKASADSYTVYTKNQLAYGYNGSYILLSSPADEVYSPTLSVTLNISGVMVGDVNLTNISLWHNGTGSWALNQTNIVTGTTNTTSFISPFPNDGGYLWTGQGCDSDGDCGFAFENRTFTIDTIFPEGGIDSPIEVEDYGFVGKTETLNWTANDTHLDACWYDYNNANTTVTCNDNTTSFTLVEDWHNITFWVNDTAGNSNSSFFEWEYKIFQNSETYNSSTHETASETFTINVTANSSLTAANLIHNSISHTGTKSGTTYSTTFDIPNSVGNKTFYWDFTYAGTHINSTVYNQTVNNTLLGVCNATVTVPYINFTFVDEESLVNINATIDTSTWTYYLGSGTVTKTLIYSNATPNDNYAFCLSASNDTMHNTRSIQYASPGYPQRKYDASSDLTNATTNKTLYLLSSTDGIYTTIQVLDTNSNQLIGVEVTVERQFSGVWTVVGQETTDSAGSVTFWVNPDYDHKFTFVKEGCTGTTVTIRPTQTQYTQQLACGVTSDYTATIQGIKYFRTPVGGIIQSGVYNFTYRLISSEDNIINASFYLVNASDQTVLNSSVSSCTTSGCLLYFTYNVSGGDNIKGKYYVDVGNGSILLEGDAWWRCIDIDSAGKAGIKTLFYDIIFIFQEWGDDSNTADFNRLVCIFFFLCVCISILNYNFNMDSMNPGMFLTILTFFIIMGSIVGGTNPTAISHGLFYYNNLTTSAFVNNYLLAFICTIISFSSFLNVNRQGQR